MLLLSWSPVHTLVLDERVSECALLRIAIKVLHRDEGGMVDMRAEVASLVVNFGIYHNLPRVDLLRENVGYKADFRACSCGVPRWRRGNVLASQSRGPGFEPRQSYDTVTRLLTRAHCICEHRTLPFLVLLPFLFLGSR